MVISKPGRDADQLTLRGGGQGREEDTEERMIIYEMKKEDKCTVDTLE